MERRLPLTGILLILFSLLPGSLRAQNLNQNDKVQILLWAEREAYPGVDWESGKAPEVDESQASESDSEAGNPYALPVSRLKKIAPFFVQGMVYGWNVEYTPSDKARGVKEYLEFTPVQELTEGELKSIQYNNAAFKDDRLYCRVEFVRSEANLNLWKGWNSVTYPKVRGYGYAKLEKGFDGIREACGDAMKNAVREYWRQHIRNKPREIDSKLILCTPPVIGVDSGRYVVTLDFLMETDRILEYEMF